jgi:hypothetical protein
MEQIPSIIPTALVSMPLRKETLVRQRRERQVTVLNSLAFGRIQTIE